MKQQVQLLIFCVVNGLFSIALKDKTRNHVIARYIGTAALGVIITYFLE